MGKQYAKIHVNRGTKWTWKGWLVFAFKISVLIGNRPMRGREISVRETRVPGSTHHSSRRSSGRSGTGGSQCPSDVAYVHQQKRKRQDKTESAPVIWQGTKAEQARHDCGMGGGPGSSCLPWECCKEQDPPTQVQQLFHGSNSQKLNTCPVCVKTLQIALPFLLLVQF